MLVTRGCHTVVMSTVFYEKAVGVDAGVLEGLVGWRRAFFGIIGMGLSGRMMRGDATRLSHKNVLTPTHAFCHVFSADFQHI